MTRRLLAERGVCERFSVPITTLVFIRDDFGVNGLKGSFPFPGYDATVINEGYLVFKSVCLFQRYRRSLVSMWIQEVSYTSYIISMFKTVSIPAAKIPISLLKQHIPQIKLSVQKPISCNTANVC